MDTQENNLFNTILIAGFFIGAIILLFILFIIKHQKRSIQLHKSKLETEIITLENERRRISRDFHDELGPTLSAIKFKISSLEVHSEDDERIINELFVHLNTVMQSMRDIAGNLLPVSLEWDGLGAAVNQFIKSLYRTSDLLISFTFDDTNMIPLDTSLHMYRIIQEITNNTIKHANAHFLLINITCHSEKIVLQTTDDGVGFSYNPYNNQSYGHGLRSIHSRTEMLKGAILINTKQGAGTAYKIEIPNK